jgi:hypothetical protein
MLRLCTARSSRCRSHAAAARTNQQARRWVPTVPNGLLLEVGDRLKQKPLRCGHIGDIATVFLGNARAGAP